MSKYDEFDLDIRTDLGKSKEELEQKDANSITVPWCPWISDVMDCWSKETQCTGAKSACSPCGSGLAAAIRC